MIKASLFAFLLLTSHASLACEVREQVIETRDPVAGAPEKVWYFLYQPSHAGKTPGTLIIHPPTGGITPLDTGYAKAFCKRGLPVALLKTWDGYHEEGVYDFGTHDRASARAIAATEALIDHLGTPVALLGESVGAIYSSMVLGRDARVRAAVLIAGGGPLVDVLEDTDQAIPAEARKKRMAEYHIATREEYRRELEANVHISPTDHADPARRGDVYMVIAKRDTTVPTSTQWALWKAWGEPRYSTLPMNHVHTIIGAALVYRHEIEEFVLGKL